MQLNLAIDRNQVHDTFELEDLSCPLCFQPKTLSKGAFANVNILLNTKNENSFICKYCRSRRGCSESTVRLNSKNNIVWRKQFFYI